MRLRSNHVLPPISEYVPRRRRTTRSVSAQAGTEAATETAPEVAQETLPESQSASDVAEQSAAERPAAKRKPAKRAGRKKVSSGTSRHNCSQLTHVSRRPRRRARRPLLPPRSPKPSPRKTPLRSFHPWSNLTPVRCPPSCPPSPRIPRACTEDALSPPFDGAVPATSCEMSKILSQLPPLRKYP